MSIVLWWAPQFILLRLEVDFASIQFHCDRYGCRFFDIFFNQISSSFACNLTRLSLKCNEVWRTVLQRRR